MREEYLHELSRLFMDQFNFEPLSLNEFLSEYRKELTDEQKELGYYILDLFYKL